MQVNWEKVVFRSVFTVGLVVSLILSFISAEDEFSYSSLPYDWDDFMGVFIPAILVVLLSAFLAKWIVRAFTRN
jgi:uncharacterized protein YacL